MPTTLPLNFLRVPALLITAFGVLGGLYFGRELLLPLALAGLLSFLLSPMVRRLDRLGLPRVASVVVVVLTVFAGLGCLGWVVTGQFINLSDNMPRYRSNLLVKARSLHQMTESRWSKARETLQDITSEITRDSAVTTPKKADVPSRWTTPTSVSLWERITSTIEPTAPTAKPDNAAGEGQAVAVKVVELPPSPLAQIQSWLGPLVAPLSTAGVVVVLVVFMLIGREDLRDRILALVGRHHLQTTTTALDDATARLTRYLRMQLLVNTIYGVLVAIGLYCIGLPNALLWGVLATMLRFLPYLGPWLAASMPIVLSLAVFESWTYPLGACALFVVLELVVNNVLEPYLYGSSTGVSSFGIIVSAIFWTWLWGPVGLVLAMPLTVWLVVIGNYVPALRFVATLLSDSAGLSTEVRYYQRLLAMDADDAEAIADHFATEHSRPALYDRVLVPTLSMLCADRQAGVLRDEQEEFGLGLLADCAADDESRFRALATNDELTWCSVGCLPAHDEADERAGQLLRNLLFSKHVELTVTSPDRLASELIEDIRRHEWRCVLISTVDVSSSRHARYLLKRLRAAHPHLAIIVGLWGEIHGPDRVRERLLAAGATDVVLTFEQAVATIATHAKLSSPTGTMDRTETPAAAVA